MKYLSLLSLVALMACSAKRPTVATLPTTLAETLRSDAGASDVEELDPARQMFCFGARHRNRQVPEVLSCIRGNENCEASSHGIPDTTITTQCRRYIETFCFFTKTARDPDIDIGFDYELMLRDSGESYCFSNPRTCENARTAIIGAPRRRTTVVCRVFAL